MNLLKARLLLLRAAKVSMDQKEAFSKHRIQKRISEIKYLTSQKKVPRISLRKEIIHLENDLEGIFQLEESLIKAEKRESMKITVLKRQIMVLKKRITASGNKNIHKKVEKLSHLLGDSLAKREVHRDVLDTREPRWQEKTKPVGGYPGVPKEMVDIRVKSLRGRIEALRQEIEVNKVLKEDGLPKEKVELMEKSIRLLEQKLRTYLEKTPHALQQQITPGPVVSESEGPQVNVESHGTKPQHIMLFSPGEKVPVGTKEHVPLPPEPKYE